MAWLCCGFFVASLQAQTVDQESETEEEVDALAVVDDAPWASARASGMSGALSSLADGIEAPYFNPAGIGGLHWTKRQRPPWIREFYFPYLAVGANGNTSQLQQEFKANGGENKSTGAAILKAQEGERQYLRQSLLMSMTIGRIILVPSYDFQVAAVPTGDEALVDTYARTTTGFGAGFSVTDPKENVYLGYFGQSLTRTEARGEFDYSDLANKGQRDQVFSQNSSTYTGLHHNLGFIWRFHKKVRPALGISIQNAGNTQYTRSSGAGTPPLVKERLNIGFSLSPEVGKTGSFNFIIEGQDISRENVTLKKKLRIGTELSLGGFGNYALFGVRVGVNHVGASGGLSLKLGLVNFEMASEAVDIGVGNKQTPERRNLFVFSTNVSEF